MANIIDGKLVSQKIRENIKKETELLYKNTNIIPGLAVILVGENPASKIYVKNKQKACEEVGFLSKEYILPTETTEKELLNLINILNKDNNIHGILVQSPLPSHLNENFITTHISPEKDVDAFHPINVGKIMIGNYDFLPCTPAGVIELLKFYNIEIQGKKAVIVGRSNIVGKPQSMLLLHENATITICHSKTKNIEDELKKADIIIMAIGKSKFLKKEMIKENCAIIDVGINRDENGKLTGDVDFEDCFEKASYITPVPGGVGPMTITMLLKNTLTAAKKSIK